MTVLPLRVAVAGTEWCLEPGSEFTFGRDPVCDACLDPDDDGLSRLAGAVRGEATGWYVVNLSRKRALHVVDGTGIAVPLPVAAPGWPPGRRAIDQPVLTVLVPGRLWTHAVVIRSLQQVHPAAELPLADPISTSTQLPDLTPARREVLAVMARGYLRPHPHYDPRPLTYQQTADLLGLRESQVRKRVEQVRGHLVASGVSGLDTGGDARRALCEWLLSMRAITAEDYRQLIPRIDAVKARRHDDVRRGIR